MKIMSAGVRASCSFLRRPVVALACVVAVPWLVLSPAAMGGTAAASSPSQTQTAAATAATQSSQTTLPQSKAIAAATLQQCATATIPQTERSATFAGEMSAIPGTAHMEIRIDLEERVPGELAYRTVDAPGLGVWHSSVAGVKIFTHIQQVTNLSAPALYRGALRFRWVNDKGRLIKAEELRTARCEQPAASSSAPATSPAGAGSTTTTTTAPTS